MSDDTDFDLRAFLDANERGFTSHAQRMDLAMDKEEVLGTSGWRDWLTTSIPTHATLSPAWSALTTTLIIEFAQLARMSQQVVKRAKEVLASLQRHREDA